MNLRNELRLDDLQPIIDLHGVFAKDRGWNATFKAYVAGPLMQFQKTLSARSRIWIAEEEKLAGCIAIVEVSQEQAQLRWFLVAPEMRGKGLGKRLLGEALAFVKEQGYAGVFLWTEASLKDAARLYRAAGFRKTEEKASWKWGAKVVEERWELIISTESGSSVRGDT